MSETPQNPPAQEDQTATGPAPKSRRKLVIFVAVACLLAAAAGAGWYFLSGDGASHEAAAEAPKESGEPAYVEVPAMVVNLRSVEGRTRYLKARVTIEAVDPETADRIKQRLPAIVDSFQGLLHGIRPEDIAGSTGLYRLKEEMMVRATRAAAPHRVSDILVQELVLQ